MCFLSSCEFSNIQMLATSSTNHYVAAQFCSCSPNSFVTASQHHTQSVVPSFLPSVTLSVGGCYNISCDSLYKLLLSVEAAFTTTWPMKKHPVRGIRNLEKHSSNFKGIHATEAASLCMLYLGQTNQSLCKRIKEYKSENKIKQYLETSGKLFHSLRTYLLQS